MSESSKAARLDGGTGPASESAPAASARQAELLELLVEQSLDGVMELNLVEGTARYSARWKAQLGYEQDELLDSLDTWETLSHPEDLAAVRTLLADHIESFWPFAHTWRMRHQNGEWRWMQYRFGAVRDASGKAMRLVAVATDVTDRVRAEERQRVLASAIPDLLMRVRLDGTVLDSKPAERGYLANLESPEPESSLADWLSRRGSGPWDAIREAMQHTDPATVEIVVGAQASAPKQIEVRIARSTVDEAVLILRDVTDERRRVTLQHQRKKLEAIGQLAAGIAHEINTPAQFLGDSIQFLAEATKDTLRVLDLYRKKVPLLAGAPNYGTIAEEIRTAEADADLAYIEENVPAGFERAQEGIRRIATIIGAMKDFAHPSQSEKGPADLNRALLATLAIARNEYKYVADVESDLGELPLVVCHLGDINQVFLNLIVNAAHAISGVVQAGGPRGRICVRTVQEDDEVCIEIGDTGPGIPPEAREHIFEPFFTTKAVGRGTGQGLAIARAIVVEGHGGSLTFDTCVGSGTTFRVRVPIRGSTAP